MQAIALYRVSTYKQSVEGHSLDAQEQRVTRVADSLGLEIVKSWRIDASSKAGKNITRKDLQEALLFCAKNKQVKYFLVDELDRFMRSINEYYWFQVEFERLGVKLLFASQSELNEGTGFARLRELLTVYEAQASNEERSRKTTDKMKARVAAGYYPFYPRQGYKKSDTPGLHAPDEPRFSLLQTALRAVANIDMTPKEAQRWLYDNGYRTPGGKKLDMNHFHDILLDPYYVGILQVKDWPEATGLHQNMITRIEFQNNVEIITGRKKLRRKKFNPEFPLNLAMHEPCLYGDGKLTGINHSNGKGWQRKEYLCRTCKKRVPRDKVHESLSCLFETIKPSEEGLKELRNALASVWKHQESSRIQQAKQLQGRLDSLNEQKGKLIRSLVANNDLADDIKAEVTNIKAEIQKVERNLTKLNTIDEELEEFTQYALSYTENLRSNWWSLEPEKRNECKQLLFQGEILVTQDAKVYTPKLSPIYTLYKAKSSPKAAKNINMVELAGTAPASASLSD